MSSLKVATYNFDYASVSTTKSDIHDTRQLQAYLVTPTVKHKEVKCSFADTLLNNTQIEARKTKRIEYTSNTAFITKVHRVYAISFEYLHLNYKQHTKLGYSM